MDLLKLAVVFLLILISLGLKAPLYFVMPGAALLLGILFSMPAIDWIISYGQALCSGETLEIVLSLWFIMLLEGLMSDTGYLDRMTKAVDALFHSRRIDIIFMPMLIGFLPSAGGALFSASVVDKSTAGLNYSAETKGLINIYYRHILELFFPTSAAMILTAQMSGVKLISLVGCVFPIALVTALFGLHIIRPLPPHSVRPADDPLLPRLGRLLLALWPFLLILVLIAILPVGVHISCLITLIALYITVKKPLRELTRLIKEKTKWQLIATALTILAFQEILTASNALRSVPDLVNTLPISPVLVLGLLAFLVSVITGECYSAAPIVLPLALASLPNFSVATAAFFHVCAHLGEQITPINLNLPLSAQYFRADLRKMVLRTLPYYAIVLLLALVVYVLLPN